MKKNNLAVAALLGLSVASTNLSASVLADWRFEEPFLTLLSQTTNHVGGPTWDRDLGVSSPTISAYVDGEGNFHARRVIDTPAHAYAPFSVPAGVTKFWKVVDIASWYFNPVDGPTTEEVFLGFPFWLEGGSVLNFAEMRLRRLSTTGPTAVNLRGVAGVIAEGGTPIAERDIFTNDRVGQPLRLVLEVDTAAGTYTIYYKESEEGYHVFGSATIMPNRRATHIRLGTLNNFGHDGEHVDFDRIFVTTENPIDKLVTPPLSGFAAWIADYYPNGGDDIAPGADPDGDGLSNLVEYALGLNPADPDREAGPSHLLTDGRLGLSFPRNPEATDVAFSVKASANLETWSEIATAAPGQPLTAQGSASVTVQAEGNVERVIVHDDTTVAGATRRFLRVDVTLAQD
jgi:hypothetical protein